MQKVAFSRAAKMQFIFIKCDKSIHHWLFAQPIYENLACVQTSPISFEGNRRRLHEG